MGKLQGRETPSSRSVTDSPAVHAAWPVAQRTMQWNTPYRELCEKLRTMNEEELEKVSTFIGWKYSLLFLIL